MVTNERTFRPALKALKVSMFWDWRCGGVQVAPNTVATRSEVIGTIVGRKGRPRDELLLRGGGVALHAQ